MSNKRDYLWNTAAGLINASEAVVMSMVVTRYGQLSDAGALSLAFATGNVLMTIGLFGGKIFQATDIKHQYTFRMYMIQRVCSLLAMFFSLLGIVFISGYGMEKALCIMLISGIYMEEVVENCIWGNFQSQGLLYLGAEMFCTRWGAILLAFVVSMFFLRNMLKSLVFGVMAGTIVFIIWVVNLFVRNRKSVVATYDYERENIMYWLPRLFRQTFPLFASSFCSIFVSNLPKFAIDKYLNDEYQACYGFVAMPVFVIGLLNQFIYQPNVIVLTNEYHTGKTLLFKKRISKQMFEVVGIMAICVCAAALFGIPVLSFVFNTDLKDYWGELVILQFAGGFLALSGYFNVVLTIMRKQTVILSGYLSALVAGIIVISIAVRTAGTFGASIGYLIVMVILFAYYYYSYLKMINGVDDI